MADAIRDATQIANTVRDASALVAQAISKLAGLGAEAPMSVREALGPLGCAYSCLGWAQAAEESYAASPENRT